MMIRSKIHNIVLMSMIITSFSLLAGCTRGRLRTGVTMSPLLKLPTTPVTTVLPASLHPKETATVTTMPPAANTMDLKEVKNAKIRGAVCNDGSPARYYFRRGAGSQGRLWVIHLQGGGMCYSRETCEKRESELPGLMTSNNKPAYRPGDGIESPSVEFNPDFAAANQVYLMYCSSDLWSGNRGAANPAGLQFRGVRIFKAIIDDLSNPSVTAAPNLAGAEQVLLTGSSGGGVGVLVHLDWLAQRLPHATVRGVTDAGWFMDLPPYDPNIDSLAAQVQLGYKIWNARVDASCRAANRGSEGQCYFGPHVYPYLASPLFVQIAQSDGPQLLQLGLTLPLDTDKEAYISVFGQAVRTSLQTVQAAFSPSGTTHGLLTDEEFWEVHVNGFSFREILGNWFFGRPGPIKEIAP